MSCAISIRIYLQHFPAAGAPIIGGSATFVHGLAIGLGENGAAVSVLCEGARRSSTVTQAGYRIECFPRSRRRFDVSAEFKRYISEQMAGKRIVTILNGMFHPGVYAVARALAANRIPYVAVPLDPYDASVFRHKPHLKWPYWFLFERWLLVHAAAIQVFDRRHIEPLVKLGIRTPAIEVLNGFCPQAAPSAAVLRWDRDGPVRILFLGRMDAYNKGLDILLEAFARVAAFHEGRLTIQGQDLGDRTRLERQAARLSLSGTVEFRNADYGRTGSEIAADHDIFCLPSRFEGFSQSAMEAMLAARMLLVSAIAGIAPHVEASGCGIAVKPDVASVAEGLVALLEDRVRWKERGLSGRAYALATLPWKRVAAQALEKYEALTV